ncbi:MAG TPA: TonB-dependent receptor [Candidatus Sulfotelmatobacter sp.]|nr:TonB-dependent receptor [Candidatus Sulfotelmatobacter sp.]
MQKSKVAVFLMKAVFVVVTMLALPSAQSQTVTTGAIAGTVTDPAGAVIAGVKVTATDKSTGLQRTTETGEAGTYRFSLLPPSVYQLQFSVTGFKTAMAPPVTVVVTEISTVNLAMQVGQIQETVNIQADVQLVQTETATLGTVVDNLTMNEVPLTTRNYTQVLSMSPGVVSDVNNASALGKGTQDMYVNGSSNISNNFQMDGSDINNYGSSRADNFVQQAGIAIPSPDAIQEFKIQTTLYDAGYGRDAGANVDVVTKSGTNQVHGSLFEFFRNDVLNANDFFLNRNNQPRPVMKQNQFGGTLGAPIIKDRLFVFGSYQRSTQVNGLSPDSFSSNLLPPLTDDRSAAGIGAVGCTETPTFGTVQVACDGSNINPVALKLLNIKNPDGTFLIPTPQKIVNTQQGIAGFSAYSLPGHFTEDQILINTDYVVSPKHRLSERYFYARDPQVKPFSGCFFEPCTPGSGVQAEFKNYIGSLKLTSTLSSTFVNEALVNYTRNTGLLTSQSKITDQSLGIIPGDPGFPKMPVTTIFGQFSIGGNFNDDSDSAVNQMQYSDQIAWTHGKHTLRAGFQFERNQFHFNDPGPRRGILIFTSFPDFLLGLSAAQNGSTLSNVFLSDGIAGDLDKNYRANDYATFVQDDFKVSRHLTLNVGLRWEINGGVSDAHGKLSSVFPSLAQATQPTPGNPTFAGFVVPSNFPVPFPSGITKLSGKTLARTDTPLHNLGPRFGFAWQPLPSSARLVVRGGYGLFFTRTNGNAVLQTVVSQPFVSINTLTGPGASLATFQAPFNPAPTPGVFTPRSVTGPPLTADFVSEKYDSPLAQEYSLNVQYEFAPKTMLEVGYVGTRGNRLAMTRNINESLLASSSNPVNGLTTNTGANAPQRVPILGFAPNGLVSIETEGASMYNSLQVTVRRQLAHGMEFQTAYTYGKAMTNVESGGHGPAGGSQATFTGGDSNSNSPTDLRQQWGPADFDRTQRLILSYLWELPHPSNGFLGNKVLGGWAFSGVTTAQSGDALTLTDPLGGSIFGDAGTSRAELRPGLTTSQIATHGTVEQRLGGWFDTNAVCAAPDIALQICEARPTGPNAPPINTLYGNLRRGTVRGPHQFNFDMALSKRIPVGGLSEAGMVEFRSEFFNAFNHPQFSDPGLQFGTAGFGQIIGTNVAPRMIQFALKYSF